MSIYNCFTSRPQYNEIALVDRARYSNHVIKILRANVSVSNVFLADHYSNERCHVESPIVVFLSPPFFKVSRIKKLLTQLVVPKALVK